MSECPDCEGRGRIEYVESVPETAVYQGGGIYESETIRKYEQCQTCNGGGYLPVGSKNKWGR